MTMTDYVLMAASAAAILLVAAYWWRRAPEGARIIATEIAWFMGSLFGVQYAWAELTRGRPIEVGMTGSFALTVVWIGGLLPVAIRRATARMDAAQSREDEPGP